MNKKSVVKVLLTAAFLGATGLFYSCSEKTDSLVMELMSQSPQPSNVSEHASAPSDTVNLSGKVYVYICGQVKKPEVYELAVDSRVTDAVELAGGFTKQAAPECVNLARVVVDGEQIYIPSKKEMEQGSYSVSEKTTTEDKVSGLQEKDKSNQTNTSQLVNINQADLKELMELPGIGETKAAAIISYREEHGSFQSKEELMNITGIKTGLYTKIKDYIKVK